MISQRIITFLLILLSSFLFFSNLYAEDNKNVSLKIDKAEVIDSKNIEVFFNLDLMPDYSNDFKIVEKNNSINEIEIESISLVKPNTLDLFLKSDLTPLTEYDITAISVKGKNGENIEEWVYWIYSLKTSSNLKKYSEENNINTDNKNNTSPTDNENNTSLTNNKNNTSLTNNEEDIIKNLNSAWEEEIGNFWKEISDNELNKKVNVVAKKVEKLPTTWPETIFLIIFSLLLTFWFLYKGRKI